MKDVVRARKNIQLICFGISYLSNFVVIKSLRTFGGFLVDNNYFFFWKKVLSYLFLLLSRQLWNFFQINIMVGTVGSDKCNAVFFFSLKLWLKYFCKTLWYAVDVLYQVNKYSVSSFNRFSLLFVTILTIHFANDSDILFFVCGRWQLM